ncbi:MAG TPA: hypothetical protein PLG50_09790 [bacterium]|nr:hypothetical protein [bacterium]HQG45940.1 hypothetical protein [bacterium]HQI49482.1 hypothetical protein [bacterium]HQJ64834.1 hypothetical protein [bacterium]
MTGKTKAIASLIAAFILGFLLCFAVFKAPDFRRTHRGRLSPEQFNATIIERFTRELSLNASQIESLKAQLKYIRTQHDSLRQCNEAAFGRIRDQFRREFSKVLSPKQQQRFIEFNRKEDEKFRRHQPADN